MNVVVPYTTLHPVTRAVLIEQSKANTAIRLAFVHVGGDDLAYAKLLAYHWLVGETIIVVEHDVVPWPGAIEELHGCPAEWCSCSYNWTNGHGRAGVGIHHMLGCTKLSGELMAALPDLWDEPCHWSQCDQRLFFAARDIGKETHPHRPGVTHIKGM